MPGWGQIYARNLTKAKLILGSELGLFITATYAYIKNKKAGQHMRSAVSLEEKSIYYKRASKAHQLHLVCICAALGVWAYSILDAHANTISGNNNFEFGKISHNKIQLLAESLNNDFIIGVKYKFELRL